jgi:transcriptional regulator with XRE-family HTH domain
MQRGWVVSPHYRSAIDAIKAVRIEQGITQRELARRLGKPPSFVNKTEQLERRLDVLEFIAIAHAMNIEPGALLAVVVGVLPEHVSL